MPSLSACRPRPGRIAQGPRSALEAFAPPRTYAPPAFVTGQNGRDLIPLTTGEARRLFNLGTSVIRPRAFHEQWAECRRYPWRPPVNPVT